MDGLPGLEMVFNPDKIETKITVQRCQVHVARNVLAKKQAVADDIRSIFYASLREKGYHVLMISRRDERSVFCCKLFREVYRCPLALCYLPSG